MSAEINLMENQLSKGKESRAIRLIKEHRELIAALFSGVLILTAWGLNTYDASMLSTFFYLIAFVIGGFAKAKEGVTATLADKELNVEMLMIFAAIGSAIIGYWAEGAILIFIFALSGALETYTMNKSNRDISSLMSMQPEEATLMEQGIQKRVSVASLQKGDLVLVKSGERLPTDGIVYKGQTTLDESAITGESLPVYKEQGDEVYAGTINTTGSLTVEVTALSSESMVQKIINLVHSAQSERSPSQQFIEKFEGTYVKVVLGVVLLMFVSPPFIFGWSWHEAFYRAMVLLVVASPCALVASIMPATLSAISKGARHGILCKGGIHLEKLGTLQAIALDKTGTLTKGKPEVTDFIVKEGENEKVVKQVVAFIESYSNHPLAKAIVRSVSQENTKQLELDAIEEVTGFGVRADIQGDSWKVGKEAFVIKKGIINHFKDMKSSFTSQGKTVVYVERNGEIITIIALKDTIREEAKDALAQIHALGIDTIMITGDNEKTAHAIAKEVKLKRYIADCLPEEKVEQVKKLTAQYENVAMVGDGINDAPALATASVGVAMGEGSDVALETADVVLMKNELLKIPQTIQLSKKMNRIIKQNIIFSISVIVLLIAANFLQVLDLPLGVIGHEGSTILVILNGLRLLRDV